MTDNYYNSQLQNNEEESSITLADLWIQVVVCGMCVCMPLLCRFLYLQDS